MDGQTRFETALREQLNTTIAATAQTSGPEVTIRQGVGKVLPRKAAGPRLALCVFDCRREGRMAIDPVGRGDFIHVVLSTILLARER